MGIVNLILKNLLIFLKWVKKIHTYLYQLGENSLERSKIHYLRENDKEVSNPYYGDESDFLNVFHILENAYIKQLDKFL